MKINVNELLLMGLNFWYLLEYMENNIFSYFIDIEIFFIYRIVASK